MRKTIFASVVIVCIAAVIIVGMRYFFRENENENIITLYANVDVRQVDIGFRVNGRVTQLYFEEGDQVKKGDLMCTMDPTPYDSQLQEAEAYAEVIRVQLENANILLSRRLQLIGIGAISQEDLDNARASRDQLRASLLQVEGAVNVAKDNLSYTQTYAPTDGIILTRIREPGTVVSAAEPVYTLSVSSPVWIRAFVDEPNLGLIHYGMEARVYTDIKNGKSYSGKIGFISPVAEFTPKTVETTELRTDLVYRLRVYVANPDHLLVQGMPITIKLYPDRNKNVE